MWKTPRTLLVSGVALVVGLGVGAAVIPALAAQDPVLTPDQQSQLQSQIEAHRACLQAQIQQQGLTLPEKPTDGTHPRLTDEQRAALRAALEACETQRPARPELSDEQKAQLQAQMAQYRACLEANGLTIPTRPQPSADGTRPQWPQLTEEQRAAMRAASEAARTACADVAPNFGVQGLGAWGGLPAFVGPRHGFGGLRPDAPGQTTSNGTV